MLPTLYDEYLRVIQEVLRNDNICYFDETLFSEIPTDTVALVIKNYGRKGGLSEFISRNMIKRLPKDSDIISLN